MGDRGSGGSIWFHDFASCFILVSSSKDYEYDVASCFILASSSKDLITYEYHTRYKRRQGKRTLVSLLPQRTVLLLVVVSTISTK